MAEGVPSFRMREMGGCQIKMQIIFTRYECKAQRDGLEEYISKDRAERDVKEEGDESRSWIAQEK